MDRKQRLAQLWLMAFDGEAKDFWRGLPPDSDFVGAMRNNLNSFSPEPFSDRHADLILSL